MADAFKVGNAKAVIVTIADKSEATRAVIALRRMYPEKPIFARAKDADHAKRLQTTLDVAAMVPILPEDNVLLTLPFGGAVLRSLGAPPEEVNYILANKRREVLSGKELEKYEEEAVMAQLGMETEKEDEQKTVDNEVKDIVKEGTSKSEAIKPTVEVTAQNTPEMTSQAADKDAEETPPPKKEKDELKPLLKQVVEANTSQKKPVEKEVEKEGTDDDKTESPKVEAKTEERDEIAA